MRMLQRIDQLPAAHFVVDRLGGRALGDAVLGRAALPRRLPGSGVRYRHRFVDTFMVADEVFGRRVYDSDGIASVRTFADLGCSVGYFVAWLAHRTGRRDLLGIAIDADRRMVRETEWVADANGLEGVTALCGLVGAPDGGETQDFFISPVGPRSTRFPTGVEPDKHGGSWRRVEVRALDVEAVWCALVGDVPCDLLKIDVEGAEVDFVHPDNRFFARVDQVLLEWHAWVVSPEEMEGRLAAMSFEKVADLACEREFGVAHYRRASTSR
jgi:FkbM family methyltransferase